jgi:hypothetical protein
MKIGRLALRAFAPRPTAWIAVIADQLDHCPAAYLWRMDLLTLASVPINGPRRMGAALTHALFTGGDRRRGRSRRAVRPHRRSTNGPNAAPSAGGRPNQSPNRQPGRPGKLGIEESAATRTQLIQEIETLPSEDVPPPGVWSLGTIPPRRSPAFAPRATSSQHRNYRCRIQSDQ